MSACSVLADFGIVGIRRSLVFSGVDANDVLDSCNKSCSGPGADGGSRSRDFEVDILDFAGIGSLTSIKNVGSIVVVLLLLSRPGSGSIVPP